MFILIHENIWYIYIKVLSLSLLIFICISWFSQCPCELNSILFPLLIGKEIKVRKFKKSAQCKNAQKKDQDSNFYLSYFPWLFLSSYFQTVWLCW